ncbi:MAG TPA: lytic transglycosylase domain-containing protein, partial [Thermoanaerobaculia bacterium]|nr:lytic transglycosylase domain-containing protein [Thermoanaerobaculia bacterium]
LALLLGLAVAGAARAELVLLQGGDVVKVKAYEIGPEQARLTLPSGGVLTLSVLRIDRVLADEIVPLPEPPPTEPAGLVLGYRDDAAAPATPYGDEILAAARRHRVNPTVVAAVMQVESAFDAAARSRKGARGLMQLMPATAARFGVTVAELLTPERNVDAGTRYLRFLVDRFGEDPVRVFAAYNAGEHAVDRYGGMPPYRETQDYVRRVLAVLGTPAMAAPAVARR